jgi:tetratricopeptide (TPR) repeat protein
MSNLAKLKKKAAEFEQKKQYEKALELYQQVLDSTRATDEERDVPLYNRVGDLHFRVGNTDEAINFYEKAVDLYAEGGFFNNAIALCNKILRYSPNRSSAYYKLGLISAKKGFNSDAKQNFLEYADRMQKVGKLDEAFRALKEFADLCPGQDDVRLMLAEQLARADRKPEALEQLQLLYDTLESEGRTTEAAAAVERMKTLDPGFTPKKTITPRQRKKDGLVFLDLGYDDELPDRATQRADLRGNSSGLAAAPIPEQAAPLDGLQLTSLADEAPSPRSTMPVAVRQDLDLILMPAVEEPLDASGPASEVSPSAEAEPEKEKDQETAAPIVYETSTGDPLAGLDVISTPDDIATPDVISTPDTEDGAIPRQYEAESNRPETDVPPIDESRAEPAETSSERDYVDLAQWLEETRTPQSTRMVAHDEVPEDNKQKDFAEMLEKFKQGVARSVDDADFDSHYDLGIAFREMGLVDEAIGAFQKATRGTGHRVRASEALGECFIEKGQPEVAVTVLERILDEPPLGEDSLVGVFYLLGRAAEELDKPSEASAYYHRVIAVDMGFRDVGKRLAALPKASR